MCGKTAVYDLPWRIVFEYASALTPPAAFPPDEASRVNVSPSRLRRKSEPDSMVWETLPVIVRDGNIDTPQSAIWPFIPVYSEGRLPMNKAGKLISTANARLREEGEPFAPTFMGSWRAGLRVVVAVSWFYEFDSRVRPQIPYAVFPTDAPCWLMAGLARRTRMPDGSKQWTVAVITVNPNEVLRSVGHHRSPALLRDGDEAHSWLHGEPDEARALLRPHENEVMGVEAMPMNIKIPGNQEIDLPEVLRRRSAAGARP
ncbi:SOS response-associated peptidase family protein [Candidatus Leptofilum sp.]|uniref:SOS response-associated peptidase family protein n=1 Tax=Candidatus Leptofilum sp. TaxID=3241576 RepID=UPI003B5BFB66